MVKNTKGHGGYFGCDQCKVHGVYYENRMTFCDLNSAKRTDVDFRSQSNAEHHKGITPFTQLPIDMITTFPVDPMHQVSLRQCRSLYSII